MVRRHFVQCFMSSLTENGKNTRLKSYEHIKMVELFTVLASAHFEIPCQSYFCIKSKLHCFPKENVCSMLPGLISYEWSVYDQQRHVMWA